MNRRPFFPCRIRGNNNNRSFAMQVAIPFSKVMSLLFVVPFLASFLYHHHYVAHSNGPVVVVVTSSGKPLTTATTTRATTHSSRDEFILSLYDRQQQQATWKSSKNIQEYPHIFSWTASDLRQGPDIYTASKILLSLSSSSMHESDKQPPLIILQEELQPQPQQQNKNKGAITTAAVTTALNTINKWCISLHGSSSPGIEGDDDDDWWCKTRRSDDHDDKNDDSFYGIYHPDSIARSTLSNINNSTTLDERIMTVQDATSLFNPTTTRLLPSLISVPLSRLLFSFSWTPSSTITTTSIAETSNKNKKRIMSENTAPVALNKSDGTTSSSMTTQLFRRNPNKQTSSSDSNNWKQLLSRPAFLLLATLQLVLAWCYWERQIPVMHVAMYYPQMTITTMTNEASSSLPINIVPQVWRALSGSTAHFSLWHIGLNIMSFYQLSLQLENGGGGSLSVLSSSIVFFMTNLSFIAVISAVWMFLEHGKERFQQYQYQQRQQQQQQQQLQIVHSPTIGYSGVLFAWSVVATTLVQRQQYQSCPIPFLDNFCFGTNYMFGDKRFPFSWAPLIQLVLAQVFLPNVSLTGHLAGIIVGYAWTWNILALPWWTSHVELTWPALHIVSILLAMRRCPHHHQPEQQQRASSPTTFLSTLQSPTWRVLYMSFVSSFSRFVQSTCMVGKMHAVVVLLAVLVWGPFQALTLSTTLVGFCWYVMERQQSLVHNNGYNNNNMSDNTKQIDVVFLGALVRCYIVAVVLNLVNTSMTLGLWWSIPCIWILHQSPISLLLLVPIQCTTLLLGLFHVTRAVIINKEVNTANDFQKGIFHYTLGITLIQPMTETRQRLHQWLQHVQSSPSSSLHCCLERFLSTCLVIVDGGVTNPNGNDDLHCFHSNAVTTTPVTNMGRNHRNGSSSGSSRGGGGQVALFPGFGQRLGATTTTGTTTNNRESEMV